MALYAIKFSIEPNTTITNPKKQVFEFISGVLDRVRIRIPSGHFGNTGLQIWYGEKQIIPYNKDAWITGDDEVIEWKEFIILRDNPTKLTFYGYNLDNEFEHSFICYFLVIPFEIYFFGLTGLEIEKSIQKILE